MTDAAGPRSAVADPRRLAAVASYGLTGHAGDAELDRVVAHMGRAVGAPIAVINLVGPDEQCYPAERGVAAPATHVPDELSFCAYVVADARPLQVADAREHAVFRENPLVRAGAVRAYLGVPLVDEDGYVLGALSVFDPAPRTFTAADRDTLEAQVGLVRTLLSLRRRITEHEWDARLLAVQTSVLEAVATGRPLAETLAALRGGLSTLERTADTGQLLRLWQADQRLTQIATESAERRLVTERLARQDALTGLANRAHLLEAGPTALADGGAVLFVDLDRFKEVNDRGSHALGDRVLIRLAERLASVLRGPVPDGVVGRIGGDEFAAVLPGVSEATARAVADHVRRTLVEDVEVGGDHLHVSASVGVAMARPGVPFDAVLHAADQAMYACKVRGRVARDGGPSRSADRLAPAG